MARSVFNDTFDANNDVKVNSFDWSHANNLTLGIGGITPCFCELVPAKGSLRINPRFGLQFMPMNFPIQTRMKARISFYKYPLRALWKDYRDFVGNFREGLEEPYIDFNTSAKLGKMASTCSLGDYLGLPTTFTGEFGQHEEIETFSVSGAFNPHLSETANVLSMVAANSVDDVTTYLGDNRALLPSFDLVNGYDETDAWSQSYDWCMLRCDLGHEVVVNVGESVDFVLDGFPGGTTSNSVVALLDSDGKLIDFSENYTSFLLSGGTLRFSSLVFYFQASVFAKSGSVPSENSGTDVFYYSDKLPGTLSVSYLVGPSSQAGLSLATSPYYNSGSDKKNDQIKISAYAFRAYEGIYNAYFRDNRNNPYYVNGQVEYNKWIPTYDGGADSNIYELHQANWEQDFLTTAVFTPQQGDPSRPPLVGITTYTDTVSNEDGTMTTKEKVAVVDEDGKKFGVEFSSDDDGLTDVSYTELSDGQPVKNSRSLFDLATSGIAIETLRNVNAYQKFLELNMRKGYSYRDIIQGRFNVKVRYDELLMPEFLGGYSRDVDVNAVTQSVDQSIGKSDTSYAEALGSQAGIAGVRGGSDNSISVFCDEECIIMGLITVTPLPVYSQLLPKHFLYRGLLDHYQPEFNHLGFQPILYKEVCPIQAFNENPKSLGNTFGYQRPWYEYVQKYDTAHGLMRTQLRNFLMNRTFDEKPTLSQSFLLIDPEQVNDVFAVTETTDKIFGQIWFDCTAKLPIARVAIPRLD